MALNQTRRACICLMLFAAMWHRDFVFAATLSCDFLRRRGTVTKSAPASSTLRPGTKGRRFVGAAVCGSAATVCFVEPSFSRCPSLLIFLPCSYPILVQTVVLPLHQTLCAVLHVGLPLLPEALWNLC